MSLEKQNSLSGQPWLGKLSYTYEAELFLPGIFELDLWIINLHFSFIAEF